MAVNTTADFAAAAKKNDDAPVQDPEMGAGGGEDDSSNLDGEDIYDDEFDDDTLVDDKHRNRLEKKFAGSVIGDLYYFLRERKAERKAYFRVLFVVAISAIGLACILFYLAGNPPTGIFSESLSGNGIRYNTDNQPIDPDQASYSWWILFIAVRQMTAYSLARLLQVVFIDFLCLNTKVVSRCCGQAVTLLFVSRVVFWD